MHKPYVYLYVSSALLFLLGFLLCAADLVAKSQGVGHNVSLMSLVDPLAPAIQFGGFMVLIGVYHFILGLKVDSATQQELRRFDELRELMADENAIWTQTK